MSEKNILFLIIGFVLGAIVMMSVFLIINGKNQKNTVSDESESTSEVTKEVENETNKPEEDVMDERKPLKDVYDKTLIGVALNPETIKQPYAKYVIENFNSVTCENEMKPDYIISHSKSKEGVKEDPTYVAFKYDACKETVKFCVENNIKMRYHTLIWHHQTPEWFFYEDYDESKELVDAETMKGRMKNYIYGVIEYFDTEYPDLIYAIDVVNEALNGGGDYGIKRTGNYWNTTMGYEYIYYAFKYTREALDASTNMKDVKLLYNDYEMIWKVDKVGGALEAIFKEHGADVHDYIDTIGFQGHIDTNIDMDEYLKAMKGFCDLGYEVQITELDICIPDIKVGEQPTEGQLLRQGEVYKELMEGICKLNKIGCNISSVTVWGIDDAHSWKMDMEGHNGYALLWNSDMTEKPALRGMALCDELEVQD